MTLQDPGPPQKSEAPEPRVGVIAFKSVNFVSLISNYSKLELVVAWHPWALYDVLRLGFIITNADKRGRGNNK